MVRDLDRAFTGFATRNGPTILRVSLGVVFVWFGVLKVIDRSPVADLVLSTLFWAPEDYVVQALGVFEIIVGIGLLAGIAVRAVLAMFWLQMLGTFLVFVIRPGIAFRDGNPFLLTTEGEFVVKNLVLIAAGIVVASTARR
jgi:uncharacterized membrane protein YkgB